VAESERLFAQLQKNQQARTLPPVHLWHPEREGQIDIQIDQDGAWYHEGRPIRRQAMVDLFATILRRDGDDYFLVTPAEKLRIEVVDVPFIAIDLDVRGAVPHTDLLFTTNVGDHVMLDDAHPLSMDGNVPYILVRAGLEARLNRSVYYRLVEYGVEENGVLYVVSRGSRFALGNV
jgi:hypothetical protein